jgi:hypothetical protein
MESNVTYNPIQNKHIKLYCENFENLPIELTHIIYDFVKNPFKESPTANIIKRLNKLYFTTIINDPITVKQLEKELKMRLKIKPVMVRYRLLTRISIDPLNIIRRYK